MNMNESLSVAHIGNPDFHDGTVISVLAKADRVSVVIQGQSGRRYTLDFNGVARLASNRAEGMTLYAVTEMEAPQPLRRFVFVNWDEKDDASLEVTARGFGISQ